MKINRDLTHRPRLLVLFFLIIIGLLPGVNSGCDRSPESPKILIIGIDGLDFNQISSIASTGKVPNIIEMIANGSHGPLRGFHPLTEPAGWTTIATGANPDKHGIFDFAVLDPVSEKPYLATSGTRQEPAFWEILTERKIDVSVIGWPVTWPVETIRGTMVTDQLISSAYSDLALTTQGQVYPATETEAIIALKGNPSKIPFETATQFIEISQEEYAAAPRSDFNDRITRFQQIHQSMRDAVEIAKYVIDKEKSTVMAVRIDGLAAANHLFMRFQEPALKNTAPANVARYGKTVSAFYNYADQLIGELVAMTDENTTIILVSNYGYLAGLSRRPWNWNQMAGVPATYQRKREGTLFFNGPLVKNRDNSGGEAATYGAAQPQDIVPTLLALLDQPAPSRLRGKVLTGMLVDNFSYPAPIESDREVHAGNSGRKRPGDAVAISHVMRRRLYALGCLEWGNQKISDHQLRLQVKSRIADYYQYTKQLDKAVTVLREICDQEPGTIRPFAQLARIYTQQKNLSDARHTLAQALLIDPTSLDIRMNMALVYRELNNLSKATETLEKAARDHPRHSGVRVNLGMLYKEMNMLTKAEESFDYAIELSPHNLQAHLQRALMHELKKEWEPALERWQDVLRINPSNEMAQRHIVLIEQRGICITPNKDSETVTR